MIRIRHGIYERRDRIHDVRLKGESALRIFFNHSHVSRITQPRPLVPQPHPTLAPQKRPTRYDLVRTAERQGLHIPRKFNPLCNDIFTKYILHTLKVHVTGGEEDAAARKNEFLICPTTCVPLRTHSGLTRMNQRNSEVKALDLSYFLLWFPGTWADAREGITHRGATCSKNCEHRFSVDELHRANLIRLVLRVI